MSIAGFLEALDFRQPHFLRREGGKDLPWEVPRLLTHVSSIAFEHVLHDGRKEPGSLRMFRAGDGILLLNFDLVV